MSRIKKIMYHWRRIHIGEKRWRIVVDILTLGSLISIIFDNVLLLFPVGALVFFGYYIAGYIDYRLHLSKAELESDYVQYNPIVDIVLEGVEKIAEKYHLKEKFVYN